MCEAGAGPCLERAARGAVATPSSLRVSADLGAPKAGRVARESKSGTGSAWATARTAAGVGVPTTRTMSGATSSSWSRLTLVPVLDEFTREAHVILVERRIRAEDVVELLASLFLLPGAPASLRSDDGPACIATVVKEWLALSGVTTLAIAPGSPWENAYSESFTSRFEDERLHRESFSRVIEAKALVEPYRLAYNHERPHSALGSIAPRSSSRPNTHPAGMAQSPLRPMARSRSTSINGRTS